MFKIKKYKKSDNFKLIAFINYLELLIIFSMLFPRRITTLNFYEFAMKWD